MLLLTHSFLTSSLTSADTRAAHVAFGPVCFGSSGSPTCWSSSLLKSALVGPESDTANGTQCQSVGTCCWGPGVVKSSFSQQPPALSLESSAAVLEGSSSWPAEKHGGPTKQRPERKTLLMKCIESVCFATHQITLIIILSKYNMAADSTN